MFDLLKEIAAYDIITIFRHQSADADALGSQYGMKTFLKECYPEKLVFALGEDVGSAAKLFPPIDHASDEQIEKSCAIILDTANTERIDDQRYSTAKKVIKIDHHIVVENFADVSYVDTNAAATCEILAMLFKRAEYQVSPACAKYLYLGILADSISFTTTSTTQNTLLAAAYLVGCGLDVNKINQERTGISVEDFKYATRIRERVKVEDKVAYSIMDADDYESLGLNYNLAKEKVYALSDVIDFEIYCLFTEDLTYGSKGLYNGSLRSKNVPINEIANVYNGGGHAHACGVKKLDINQIKNLIDDLLKLSNSHYLK
ncbi:phosphoesterase RecJ-like protein [Breznakia sp. PF5-3]|uniref:DHH family phosphoesterase n=1 Tax=unclassified Breznakia TaxID=2623764 RepID=UPI002406E028|nr:MULTISPECIES: bifunctional oligoribonuclease/PAP phosphatase NrnA [unclassified Breznakia]MDL2276139.1 bifunctional oligoribonuclease/PAP phosphatase NrnA [Breznakia sp. OttesenSCG-928-G09]MDF9824413.1 phosphoesterase RecJ-like protein [Breznakia sp. PM6-1]MDF9835142.1 phosphoesterase RecJ-like protein [Breznakia sp. PF5-3]MDF9838210.1 phosphoesterase RecJ-like protein [Breznakia sp. PFB2-8]MDF9860225.1 phosphoesterase RecJ-like protein [Breznakia sp. PH5-24]